MSEKFDQGKLPIGLVDPQFIKDVAEILQFGAEKYAPESWKNVENGENRYYDALQRHLLEYKLGIPNDLDSGKSHLKHAACNIMFLLYFERERQKAS